MYCYYLKKIDKQSLSLQLANNVIKLVNDVCTQNYNYTKMIDIKIEAYMLISNIHLEQLSL